jgi:hypothetical protein
VSAHLGRSDASGVGEGVAFSEDEDRLVGGHRSDREPAADNALRGEHDIRGAIS